MIVISLQRRLNRKFKHWMWATILLAFLVHLFLIFMSWSKGNFFLYTSHVVISFIMVLIISLLIAKKENMILDWQTPLVIMVFSVIAPIFYMQNTVEVVKQSLRNFGVGGGIEVNVMNSKGESVSSGKLLLLSPYNVYIRGADDKHYSVIKIPEGMKVQVNSLPMSKNDESSDGD